MVPGKDLLAMCSKLIFASVLDERGLHPHRINGLNGYSTGRAFRHRPG